MIKVIGKREILEILSIFLGVQLLGVALVAILSNTSSLSTLKSQIVSPQSVLLSYSLDAILIIVITALFLNRHRGHVIFIHDNAAHDSRSKGTHISHHHLEESIIYGILEAVVVVATSFFLFLALFDIILPQSPLSYLISLSLGCAIVLIAAKNLDHKIRNAVTMVSSMGVGLLLGLYFGFEYALIGLAVISIYDYLAVFVTKSMVKLARAITRNDMSFMVSSSHLESAPMVDFPKKEVEDYMKYLHDTHEESNPRYKSILSKGRLPVISQLQLGEGDLGLPLMAAIAAYLTYPNYMVAIAVVFGAAVGLLAAIGILKNYRHPLPAIPPLFAFISIFAGIALALTGSIAALDSTLLVLIGFAVISFGMVLRYVQHRERAETPAK